MPELSYEMASYAAFLDSNSISRSTRSGTSHSLSVTPAAIAGDTRSVL